MAKSRKKTRKKKSPVVAKTRRDTKDSVFTHLFSIPKYQLELYQTLHPEDTDATEADIETITRECVIAQHEHNDLGILVKDRLMVFVEAQSTISPNIILRQLFYSSNSLMDYFRERDVFCTGAQRWNARRLSSMPSLAATAI